MYLLLAVSPKEALFLSFLCWDVLLFYSPPAEQLICFAKSVQNRFNFQQYTNKTPTSTTLSPTWYISCFVCADFCFWDGWIMDIQVDSSGRWTNPATIPRHELWTIGPPITKYNINLPIPVVSSFLHVLFFVESWQAQRERDTQILCTLHGDVNVLRKKNSQTKVHTHRVVNYVWSLLI